MSGTENLCTSESMPVPCHDNAGCEAGCREIINGQANTLVIPGAGALKEWAATQAERDRINIVNADPVEACPRSSPAVTAQSICVRNCCEFSAYKNVNFLNGDLVIGDPQYAAAPLEEVCVPGNGLVDNQVATDVFPNLLGINGNLYIVDTDYVKISGFAKLRYVTGRIVVYGNDELTEMPSFPSLLNVGARLGDLAQPDPAPAIPFGDYQKSDIVIVENPVLKRIHGFEALRQVNRAITITNNNCLRSICGFVHLYRAERVTISLNPRLVKLVGFCYTDSLNSDAARLAADVPNNGGLFVVQNGEEATDKLEFNAFQNLTTATNVLIFANRNLKSVKLDALRTVTRDLTVRGNNTLKEFTSSAVTVGNLYIENNCALESFAFPTLSEVAAELMINNNAILKLDTFNELKSVGKAIMIAENKSMTELSAFEKLKYIGGQRLTRLPASAECEPDAGYQPVEYTRAVCVVTAGPAVNDIPVADEQTAAFQISERFFENLCVRTDCDDDAESGDAPAAGSSVSYSLIVYGNDRLRTVVGFSSLRHTEASVYIIYNVVLHAIHAFTKLAYTLDMWVRNNASLKHFIGLACLMSVRDMVVLDSSCFDDLNNIKKLEFAQRLAFEALTHDAIKFSKPLPSVDGFVKYFSFDQ